MTSTASYPKPLVLLALTAVTGCSYGAFSDLADKAPAARITQDGDISSATFGDQIAGLVRRDTSGTEVEGGVLAIVGNADAAFATATLSGAGVGGVGHAEPHDLKEKFDSPSKILAMAPVPSNVAQGSDVYIGSVSAGEGTVRVIDAVNFERIQIYKGPAGVIDFGLSVAAADLGASPGTRDDLAVGARGALVLMQADSWPGMGETVRVSGAPDWPAGEFSVITAGDLDGRATAEDEVAAAIPGQNAVVVVHHVGDCFADPGAPCASAVVLSAPSGADGFGEALLIADVDGDNVNELAVGSPGDGRVYIYDLEEQHFVSGTLPEPTSIEAAGSGAFGRSLAFGKLDGDRPMLAVGAPVTETEGVKGAGRVYLFDALTQLGEGTVLASPEENALLGQRLTVAPFRSSGGTGNYDLLVASGKKSVFIFFANLTSAHKDIRFR
jgi:hypothetical protein